MTVWIYVVLSLTSGERPAVLEQVEFQSEAECIEHRDSRPVLPASFEQAFGCVVMVRESGDE